MNRRRFRLLIALAVIAIAGLVATQIYWLDRAVKLKDSQFDHNVQAALASVASQVSTRAASAHMLMPVKQIGEFQYIVLTNDVIDPNVLSFHLRQELGARGINRDFEFTLFDCSNQQLVCSDYVKFTGTPEAGSYLFRQISWPKQKEAYYFGVFFPDGDGLVLSGLGIWTFSSIAILLVAGFFGYAIYELMRQRRLSEIQRDFIDAMTHEFKTPLTTISLVGEALANPTLASRPESLARYAGMIKQEVRHLKDHVDTILTNAKDYERRPDLKLEQIDVYALTQELQASLADRVAQAGMELSLDIPAGLRVLADRVHVWSMLSTLVDNSVKYAGQGCRVTLRGNERQGHVELEVADDGPGMDTRTRRMAGSKFFRAHHDADTPKGFGLGLFYVRNTMRNHKGRLILQSRKGGGTSVTLRFPCS